jgi:hypothetical protein
MVAMAVSYSLVLHYDPVLFEVTKL